MIDLLAAIRDAGGLTAPEKLVAFALASRADVRGRCYPSRARIALDASLGESTVRRGLKRLAALGLVRVEVGGGRTGDTNAYAWQLDALRALRRETEALEGTATGSTADPIHSDTGSTADSHGVQAEPPRGPQRTATGSTVTHKADMKQTEKQTEEADTTRTPSAASRTKLAEYTEAAFALFQAAWEKRTGKRPRVQLMPRERERVKKLFAAAVPLDRIAAASYGLHDSPFHRGENDRGKRFMRFFHVLSEGSLDDLAELGETFLSRGRDVDAAANCTAVPMPAEFRAAHAQLTARNADIADGADVAWSPNPQGAA